MKKQFLTFVLVAVATLFSSNISFAQSKEQKVTVIDLSQTTGEFNVKGLQLKPGKYQFKVTNIDVNKEVGFVIQKASDKNMDVMKTALENSFTTALIKKGDTQLTGVVELKEGEYVYSCPLNPTPHYAISVKK
ncbi:hypothetical protein CHU92_07890 [Flavobacterium cyanobacteriorum]|uniref:EfeO-type cupredoxin-like domain-containing protein n=3 Tax=Flavobacterium TaxID=237 RepID=A0A256A810_9FLAO|nr:MULTISPECIES: hypothetical protein [Flavobacterium]MBM6499783.1 hypothetical protein [Flavobacterium macrobrachii]OYQ37572.1 hypothetical protein CHU92_07890 [Flavobacterium cyanobacteriorum]OYQ49294.1 hypothetical protein CHX27_01435 [Flavobacterium aurantiibacter]